MEALEPVVLGVIRALREGVAVEAQHNRGLQTGRKVRGAPGAAGAVVAEVGPVRTRPETQALVEMQAMR